MTHRNEDTALAGAVEAVNESGLEAMAAALHTLFNVAMRIERQQVLGAAPHERSATRVAYANGFKPKAVLTRAGVLDLQVPEVRPRPGGEPVAFYPQALEKGLRSARALRRALAEMYVQGVSTRKVAAITEQLCGTGVTSMQVSRAAADLDATLQAWRTRPLGACPYLALDARYEKIRHGGVVVDCAVLLALSVRADGTRTLLGVSVSLSEAEVHWRTFIESLQARGLHGVVCITSDAHAGLTAALHARFPGVPWQRCQFHLQQNAQAYVPQLALRGAVAADLRGVFAARDRAEADDKLRQMLAWWQTKAPRLVEWLEAHVPQGLTAFALPERHRRRLRTSNAVERVNRELLRRTRVATLFPNDTSLLQLATAIAAEISDESETGRVYLTMAGTKPESER